MTPFDFMRRYFGDRTEMIKVEIERRSPHREAYFAADCRWDSRRGTVESSQAEKILDVSQSGDEVLVVTSGCSANHIAFPLRYHLRPAGESWLIHEMESRCPSCQGTGRSVNEGPGGNCQLCSGKGWK